MMLLFQIPLPTFLIDLRLPVNRLWRSIALRVGLVDGLFWLYVDHLQSLWYGQEIDP